MAALPLNLERNFFRALNTVVEPAVRRGLFSSRLTPSALIVLESIGYRSGQLRRTPLFSNPLGPYRLISTVRGRRSFWVRNLQQQPEVTYFISGKQRRAHAIVIAPDYVSEDMDTLPVVLAPLAKAMVRLSDRGWAFALLRAESR